MDELKNNGTTIVMVTHDLGSVIKYCDRVMLLNSGECIATGTPHEMVDLYKKILSGNSDPINTDDKEVKINNINPNADVYGDGACDFIEFGICDEKGASTNVILKDEEFIIKEKVKFESPVKSPIFTWTIKSKRGDDLTGTNTMIENIDTGDAKKGDIYEISFRQKMRLQGGEYLLSMSCTSFEGDDLKVHKRMYDILNLTVLEHKNTVGVFDSESKIDIKKST